MSSITFYPSEKKIFFPQTRLSYPLSRIKTFETSLDADELEYLQNFVNTGRFHDKYYTLFEVDGEIVEDLKWGTVSISEEDLDFVEIMTPEVANELIYLVGILFAFINDRNLSDNYWFAYLYDLYWRENPFDLEKPKGIKVDAELLRYLKSFINPADLLSIEEPEEDMRVKAEKLVVAGGYVLHSLVGTDYGDIDMFATEERTGLDLTGPLNVDAEMFKQLITWILDEVRDPELEDDQPHLLEQTQVFYGTVSEKSLTQRHVYGGWRSGNWIQPEIVKFQLIKRLYKTSLDVILDFDIDSVRCYYDGEGFYSTLTFIWSVVNAANVINPQFYTPGFNYRLAKYMERGFQPVAPELSRRPSEETEANVRELRRLISEGFPKDEKLTLYGDIHEGCNLFLYSMADGNKKIVTKEGIASDIIMFDFDSDFLTRGWKIGDFFNSQNFKFWYGKETTVGKVFWNGSKVVVQTTQPRASYCEISIDELYPSITCDGDLITDFFARGLSLFFTPFSVNGMLDESNRFERSIVNYWEPELM